MLFLVWFLRYRWCLRCPAEFVVGVSAVLGVSLSCGAGVSVGVGLYIGDVRDGDGVSMSVRWRSSVSVGVSACRWYWC